ncbi:MAG: hypothetical protein KDD89_15585 [Anaerolineales bacterium]|nr:hypothetical protein [Anaerolineales bacterium]
MHLAKDLRHVETHLTRALRRTIRASDKGMRRYVALRETSAAREKDGVVVDFVPNVVESTAVVMRHFTLVPIDVLRASYTPSMRRLLRTALRA